MKYKKVLFIRASLATAWVGAVSPPIGIAYLVEALKKHGCECKTIDTALGVGMEEVYAAIDEFAPDIIGISMLTYKYRETYRMIESIKQRYPDKKVIAGGAHISTIREKALESCAAIDAGFVRESEESIVEFCRGTEPSDISGVIYRDNDEVKYTGDRDYVNDLDKLHWPRSYGISLDDYPSKEILILSSRGCPYSCIFCPVSLAIGKKLRVRSADDIADEVEYWYKLGYKRFAMLDDNFTFYADRTIEICDKFEKRGLNDITLRCGNGIRADRVNKDVLRRMREAGFTYVSYGVESGSDEVLQTLKKGETIEEIEEAVRLSVELGFDVTLFFVIGAPGERPEDVEKSIDVSLKYPVMDVRFYNLIPYPGTELYKWVEENNYFVKDPDEYLNDTSGISDQPVFETPELPRKTRVDLFKRLNRVTKEVRKKAIRRKLKKLGPHGTLLYHLFGPLYVSDRFQSMIRQNKLVRSVVDRVYMKTSGAQQ